MHGVVAYLGREDPATSVAPPSCPPGCSPPCFRPGPVPGSPKLVPHLHKPSPPAFTPSLQDCNFTTVAFCTPAERCPGLWEAPVYQLQVGGWVDRSRV